MVNKSAFQSWQLLNNFHVNGFVGGGWQKSNCGKKSTWKQA